MVFSQDDVSLYFHKFYLRSFKAEKGVKFLPTKLEKKSSVQGLIFVPNRHFHQLALPQLALPRTGTFCKFFLCHWKFESPNCLYTIRSSWSALIVQEFCFAKVVTEAQTGTKILWIVTIKKVFDMKSPGKVMKTLQVGLAGQKAST